MAFPVIIFNDVPAFAVSMHFKHGIKGRGTCRSEISMKQTFANILRNEFELRVFQESYPRIEKCLSLVNHEQLWAAPNEHTVSIGCLIKHLLGNAQQWMYAGVLEGSFERNRDAEFVPEPAMTANDLRAEMEAVRVLIADNLGRLSEERLEQSLQIQGFSTTGFSATVHVIEHFSYHTGQISLLTKLWKNVDLGYYDEYDLDQ